tara:strand:+ start:856 stop:1266 length:411 start_codon:yes stop_codon:yes gene_type:complete
MWLLLLTPYLISMKRIKYITIIIMSFFYIWVGIKHFVDPEWFVHIMPPFLPFHYAAVYISGFFEILFGLGLLFAKSRYYAAWGLILLLIAVYPANIYLAFNEAPQKAIGISAFAASWVRLPIQFIFLGLAYWHSKD